MSTASIPVVTSESSAPKPRGNVLLLVCEGMDEAVVAIATHHYRQTGVRVHVHEERTPPAWAIVNNILTPGNIARLARDDLDVSHVVFLHHDCAILAELTRRCPGGTEGQTAYAIRMVEGQLQGEDISVSAIAVEGGHVLEPAHSAA